MKKDFPHKKVPSGIKRKTLEVARQFRREPTRSEHLLWQALRGKKLEGVKFRRQQPIGNFVVDFYNSTYRLVIEVDGSVHNKQLEYDQARQDILEEMGLNVLRVKAEVVEKNIAQVLGEIRRKIDELKYKGTAFPSPFIGEGLGERELIEKDHSEERIKTTN